jgi:hypothetical protein
MCPESDAAGISVEGLMQLASVSSDLCSWHQCLGSDAAGFSVQGVMQLALVSRE